MNNEEYIQYLQSDKWKSIAAERMKIDGYRCQACGCKGTMTNALEIHHLSYKFLGQEEKRIFQDLVTLCHSCHKNVHAMMNRVTDAGGRRGWKDNRAIPSVHVYTLWGQDRGNISDSS